MRFSGDAPDLWTKPIPALAVTSANWMRGAAVARPLDWARDRPRCPAIVNGRPARTVITSHRDVITVRRRVFSHGGADSRPPVRGLRLHGSAPVRVPF